MNAIEVERLTKFYGPARGVVDVSFTVARGEVMGFLGPNGSGKTTTMRMLTCFFPPTSGTARICGFDITEQSLEVRRRIGYLPESVPLYREMAVDAYLRFSAEIKGLGRARRTARVGEVIERCGLGQVRRRLIGALSKGYRQRVGIAQALLHDPEVLILDEPTVGLDPRQIIEIRDLIKELGRTQTVILSTHILPEVSMTCSRVIIIHEGRLIAVDTPERLMGRIRQTPQLLVRVEAPPADVCRELGALPGVLAVEQRVAPGGDGPFVVTAREDAAVTNAIATAVCTRGWQLREIRPADMTLEEIFIQLVTDEEGTPAP